MKIKPGFEDFVFISNFGKNISRIMVFHIIKELEEAVAMGIKENTALTWLKRLTKHGKLISMDGKGLYARACVYE